MAAGYVPDEGDIVWMDVTPQSGHEQAGRRPALATSRHGGRTGLLPNFRQCRNDQRRAQIESVAEQPLNQGASRGDPSHALGRENDSKEDQRRRVDDHPVRHTNSSRSSSISV